MANFGAVLVVALAALGAIYIVGWLAFFLWLATMHGPVTEKAARRKREAREALLWPLAAFGLVLLLSADWSWRKSKSGKTIVPMDNAKVLAKSGVANDMTGYADDRVAA